jgi:glycine C-acetyltransferase
LVSKFDFVKEEITELKSNSLYRSLKTVTTSRTVTAVVNGKKTINLCSNDYLGLSRNKQVVKKTISALQQISQCSSRLIAGNSPKFEELEKQLAGHRSTESALVYPSGYMANLGVITAIADSNSTIFSDELSHSSIIDGCRLSNATVRVFRHNDIDHLKKLIDNSSGKKVIVTEGVFSMDGDISNLRQICDIGKEHNAITIIDDAHGDFIFGSSEAFSGVPSYLSINDLVDIHISSLSKALGCFGGYVATTVAVKEFLVNKSRQFIYTSALPEHLCVSALTALPIATKGDLQQRLFENIAFFRRRLKKIGFMVGQSSSQIIPILIGEEKFAVNISNELLTKGIFAQAVRYPTVKKGSARLRISLSSLHSKTQLIYTLDRLEKLGKLMNIV